MTIGIPGTEDEIINSSAVTGALSVGTSAVEVKVGASKLSGRQWVRIYNDSNRSMWVSFNASVSTSGANRGEELVKKNWMQIAVGDSIPVYIISDQASQSVVVHEGA